LSAALTVKAMPHRSGIATAFSSDSCLLKKIVSDRMVAQFFRVVTEISTGDCPAMHDELEADLLISCLM
jgi:hypothetical protein